MINKLYLTWNFMWDGFLLSPIHSRMLWRSGPSTIRARTSRSIAPLEKRKFSAKIPAISLQSNPDNGVIGIPYLDEGEGGEHNRVEMVVGVLPFLLKFSLLVLLHSLSHDIATLNRECGAHVKTSLL